MLVRVTCTNDCSDNDDDMKTSHSAIPHTTPFKRRVAFSAVLLAGSFALPPDTDAARAYVSNEDGHTVTVIDTDKATVIATVPVGKRPRGLKLSRDASRLYVAVSGLAKCPPTTPDEECAKLERDLKADGVAVIDTRSLKLLTLAEGGLRPGAVRLER